ncbi:MAG: hypothetical protein DLM57_04335 [Pseudonocardiales bacterium]|nr:MAG: hypothetical protein DLM57_04335 [Pseudonocardiales bacterium]
MSEPAPAPRTPRRNRVTPLGDIAATELRGAWTGNRGILHRGTDIVRFHGSDLWITCVLQFKDWRLPQWAPRHFTVLFFHDEAVALAAGHRPCALCRRADYNAYRQAWSQGIGGAVPSAKDMDRRLHGERIVRGTHRRRLHPRSWAELPSGTFTIVAGMPALVLDESVVPWTQAGYQRPLPRPSRGTATVITPPSSMAALSAGYRPQVDPGARRGPA